MELSILHGLTPESVGALESLALRLIQIQAETKALESEKGYTDHRGARHPGISDQLENLLIAHDLTERGFRIENFGIGLVPGGWSGIDEHLLLAEGVDPEVINRCRVSKSWVSVQVRKLGKDGEEGE